MHVFFYDPILNNSKFSVLLAKIETKITDLGLNGKIIRLNLLQNLEKTILNEIKNGQTLIFIGEDKLFNQALPFLAYKDVIVGQIPLSNKQPLALALGIMGPLEACEVLAARRTINLDLAVANNSAFLTELTIKSNHSSINIGEEISLEVKDEHEIKICNLPQDNLITTSVTNDQLLELVILAKNKSSLFSKPTTSYSFFQNSNFYISAATGATALLDSATIINLPIKVEVMPAAINVIVGKKRNF